MSSSPSNFDFETVVKQEEVYLRLVHPTPEETPSCTSLFDTYLACNAVRSQVKSWYRYGEGTKCSAKLEDFKFCMGLKWQEPDERRDAWIRRRAEWWARRRLAKSSEDVWEMRKEPPVAYPRRLTEEELKSTTPVM
ncbi:conserved protein (fungal and plant) [Moniliophthora roreri MCA 2997]|uniref:Conserved protein (Fungal and plant) n=1 Tax=Moniliophthora roreri (strain MCA 2997) TaxID=1381753 RepID=V2XTR6_MONRO|nr:conserved protein (fungal and plant) [Moniliophthora roreri MCA 2997]